MHTSKVDDVLLTSVYRIPRTRVPRSPRTRTRTAKKGQKTRMRRRKRRRSLKIPRRNLRKVCRPPHLCSEYIPTYVAVPKAAFPQSCVAFPRYNNRTVSYVWASD
jgi:hypothetical protein